MFAFDTSNVFAAGQNTHTTTSPPAPPPVIKPAAGSYSAGQAINSQLLTFYVSPDSSHVQDVTIFNTLACAPNGKTFNDTFTLSSAAINADGSFAGTENHDGVLRIATANFPAHYTYTFNGNFSGTTAKGTWQETVTYTDGTLQSCTTNPLAWTLARDAQGSQAAAPAPAGSYSAGQVVSSQLLTFYVSTDSSHIQDVSIFNTLACAPNGKTFNDTFTLSSATINPDGSFTSTQSHNGVLRIAAANFPATYTYTFTGNFHGLNSGAVERAAGTWQETVTYNDGTLQTCTTDPLPWTLTRDAQGSQAAAPAPAGSYSAGQVVSSQLLTFYVSTDSSHIQDVSIFNTLACAPNGKTFNDTFTLSSATINPDGSFTSTQSHNGVLRIAAANFPATYTYTFTGNFHGLNSGAVERAAGTWQETVTYNDGTLQTCTTDPLPWTLTRDAQGSQAAAPAPAGSYSAGQVVSSQLLTFYVSTDSSHIQAPPSSTPWPARPTARRSTTPSPCPAQPSTPTAHSRQRRVTTACSPSAVPRFQPPTHTSSPATSTA